jgi:hypothetical protein
VELEKEEMFGDVKDVGRNTGETRKRPCTPKTLIVKSKKKKGMKKKYEPLKRYVLYQSI